MKLLDFLFAAREDARPPRAYAIRPYLLTSCLFLLVAALRAQDPEEYEYKDPGGWVTLGVPAGVDFALDTPPDPSGLDSRAVITNTPPGIVMTPQVTGPLPAEITLGLSANIPPPDFERIKELARGLDFDWEKCYRFVHDHIAFVPYHGIMRGPERTLLDREGNDADQAFLLLALLRASGHDATIVQCDRSGTNGFYVPLDNHDGNTPYNAADWLGVGVPGDAAQTRDNVINRLSAAGYSVAHNSSGAYTTIVIGYFWVELNLGSVTLRLDPAFKPAVRTPARDALADAGYDRTALLAAAAGTVVPAHSVQGLSAAGIGATLDALAANLHDAWTNANTSATDYTGGLRTVPLAPGDDTYFHGTLAGGAQDFLARPDSFKDARRAKMVLSHRAISKTLFLDEIGTRCLWVSYASGTRRATLSLDGDTLAAEASGSFSGNASMSLATTKALANGGSANLNETYTLTRDANYVYVIAVGFGGDAPGGMRAHASGELARLRASGLADSTPRVKAAALQTVGHQWLSQSAMLDNTRNRTTGHPANVFYNIGVAAQTASPYVDMKNACLHAWGNTLFNGRMLFTSALEHAVLEQLSSKRTPAISTVKVLETANANPVYFATADNWATVRPLLKSNGYSTNHLAAFDAAIADGRVILAPRSASVALGKWKGYGYIEHGSKGGMIYTSMAISNIKGGQTTANETISAAYVTQATAAAVTPPITATPTYAADPVAMPSGAFTDTATDLAVTRTAPLAWTRRYDSRLRNTDGSFGRGWTPPYDASLTLTADPDAVIAARGSPDAVIPTALATAVVDDLLAAQYPDVTAGERAKRMMVAAHAVQWWTRQLTAAAATVDLDGRALTFTRRPDGVWAPTPGVTAELTKTNTAYYLKERLGSVYRFSGSGHLLRINDPSGNAVTFIRMNGNATKVSAPSDGGTLNITYTGGRIARVRLGTNVSAPTVSYAYDAAGHLTTVTDPGGKVWTYQYDPATHALLSAKDPDGNVTILNAYNALGQVTNQVSAAGGVWTFGYVAATGAWDEDPHGNRQSFAYDDAGRLTRHTARGGAVTDYAYDGQGHTVWTLGPLGRLDTFEYDPRGNLTRAVRDALGAPAATNLLAYDARDRLIASTDPLGNTTAYAYDSRDRLVKTTLPDGTYATNLLHATYGYATTNRLHAPGGALLREEALAYGINSFNPSSRTLTGPGLPPAGIREAYTYYTAPAFPTGQPATRKDPRGGVTAYTYDKRGLPLTTKDPLGNITTLTYDNAGRPLTTKDPLGRVTAYAWTPSGNPARTLYPDGGALTNAYDLLDRPLWTRDPRGTVSSNAYDTAGRVTETWAWRANVPVSRAAFAYDANGNVTSFTDPLGNVSYSQYDALNRVTSVTDPLNNTTANAYDGVGNLVATTNAINKVRQWEYNALGRQVKSIRPSGATDAFAYNAMGWNTAYTNSEGNVYTIAYDALGRMVAATNALGEQVFRAYYDNNGNVTNKIDGRGVSVHSTYDALNRLTAVFTNSTVNNARISAFTYDIVGNMLTASNAVAQETFTYDVMNRLATSQTKIGSLTFANQWQRDLGGLVTNLVYATGKNVSYTYDEDGLLSSVTDWLGNEWVFTRDPAGRLLSLSSPSSPMSPTSLFSYDNAGRLSSWNVGTLAGREIFYDAANRRIRDDITAGAIPKPTLQRTALNTFDAADRLASSSVRYGQGADSTEHITETFQYDGNGALTNWLGSPLWKGGGGNAAGGLSLAYDALGRFANGSCAYDALGNRIKTMDGNLWIPNHSDSLKRPLMETDLSGNIIRYYIWGDNRLLGFIEGNTLTVAHCDDFGSVIALTDLSGNLFYVANYGPHGEDWGASGNNPTPFTWLGGYGVQTLETDTPLRLYLTRHRVYSATLNRFLSADPIGLAGGSNLYAYGEGNPMAYIDPLGLCGQSVWGAFWEGFGEGLKGGGSILANTFTFGYSDQWGWTDSTQYQGFEYDVSRFSASVAQGALLGAGTAGLGSLAAGGSTAAQVGYGGIMMVGAFQGGYQIGNGVGNVIDGNYLTGAGQIAGGSLSAYGSYAGMKSLMTATSGYTLAGRGSTALTAADSSPAMNLRQQLAIEQAMSRPTAGTALDIKMADPRWPLSEGWIKMSQNIKPGGTPIEVHYNLNPTLQLMDDFKIKVPTRR